MDADLTGTEILVAAATVASVVVALGALVVSIIGLVRSKGAASDAQAAREGATTAQWKMTEHLEAIAEAQAKAARSAAGGEGSEGFTFRAGGRLSARLVGPASSARLVIANIGAETLVVEAIEVEPDVLFPVLVDSVIGSELDPGEHFVLPTALSMGTTFPLTVSTRWRDSGGEHERTQPVNLS